MKSLIAVIVFLSGLIFFAGCEQGEISDSTQPERKLKISDLEPSAASIIKQQLLFSVTVYSLPVENLKNVPKNFSFLSTRAIDFEDRKGFSANSLWTAAGENSQGPQISSALGRLQARRVSQLKLIVFEEFPEEMAGTPFDYGQSFLYFRDDGTLAAQTVPTGRLLLALSADLNADRPDAARVRIYPLFAPSFSPNLPVLTRDSLFQSRTFKEGAFETNLSAGDFLLLTSTKIQKASNSLHSFFAREEKGEREGLLYLVLYLQAANYEAS